MPRRNPPAKWVLPDVVNPPDSVCYSVRVPNNKFYIAAFLGCLYNLTSARFWSDDPAHTALQVAKVWQDIYDGLAKSPCSNLPIVRDEGMEIDDMAGLIEPYCDDQGNCKFHFRCDICGDWHDVATADDLTKATTSPGTTTTQPQPGGGTVQNCLKMYANALLPIPLTVNTGDTILIKSASGSWWDGGEFDFGPLWRLPSGNQVVGGLDVGFPKSGVSGDAVTAANHMSIVAVIGATPDYVALPIGTPVTVPSVAPNSQLFFMVNDDPTGIANNQGDCQVCYTVTNNKSMTWTRTLDFTVSPNGFTFIPFGGGDQGVWNLGQGFQSTLNNVSGAPDTSLIIHRTFGVATFTSANITCNTNQLPSGTGAGNAVLLRHSGVTTATVCLASLFNGTQTDSWSGSALVDEIVINPSSGNTTLFTEIRMVLTGTGAPPF